MSRYKAVIIGATGFGGAELIRRLLLHPQVDLLRVCAVDHVGEPVSAAQPNLEGLCDLRFEQLSPERAVEGADVALLGLPTAVSLEACLALEGWGGVIIDMSGAFRLGSSDAFERYYGGKPHPRPDLLDTWVYGLPELNRERIRQTRRIASPGCFATTIELGLLPLARAGWLSGPVQTVAVTGSSGSGANPLPTTHHPTRAVNLRAYRVLSHAHAPEIAEQLTLAGARAPRIDFVPVSGPLSRGILATSFARVPADVSTDDLHAAFAKAYGEERFVRVPERRLPEVVAVAGSNYAEVGVVPGEVDGDQRLVTCMSALDNLVKGGAGQAIQNMNLALDLDEATTLEDPGSYP